MKQLLFAIILLFFIIVSCSKSRPKGILSEQRMSDLMTEVYVVDGYLNTLPIDSSRKLLPVLYGNIFDRFKIDSVEFANNIDYYYGNPAELEKLSTNIKKSLSEYERNALRTDSIQQAHVADSIKTVQRWMRLAREMENLIQHVYLDTTEYKFMENNEKFFRDISNDIVTQNFAKPVPSEPMEVPESDEATALADSVGTALSELALDSLIAEEPITLIPIIDTISNLPRPFRYQQFELNKVTADSISVKPLVVETPIDSPVKAPALAKPLTDTTSRISRPLRHRQRASELNRNKEELQL